MYTFYTYLLRIRRILSPCPSYSVGPVEFGMKVFGDAYPVAYRTLYEAKSVTCSVTGTLFDAVAPPCAVILDVSNVLRSTVIYQ